MAYEVIAKVIVDNPEDVHLIVAKLSAVIKNLDGVEYYDVGSTAVPDTEKAD